MRMKWAVLRRSLHGYRLVLLWWQVAFSVVVVGLTLWVGLSAPIESVASLVALLLGVWLVGWLLGPTLFGGEDDSLRPEYFRTLPIPYGRLARLLLFPSLISMTVPVTIVGLVVLVIYGLRFGLLEALVGLIMLPLFLLTAVIGSRVITQLLRAATISQLSSLVSSAITGAVIAFFVTGWWALGTLDAIIADGLPQVFTTALYILPSGWGLAAIDGARAGNWMVPILYGLGYVLLVGLLLLAWQRLLGHRLSGTPPKNRQLRKAPDIATEFTSGRSRPVVAVLRKELRTWQRDYTRSGFLYYALFYSLFLCLYPLSVGVLFLLPFVGVLFVLNAAGATANAYGSDGTAIWQTLTTPRAARNDVRGRQYAWLLAVGPMSLLLTVGLTLLTGFAAYLPLTLGLTLVSLGAGAAVMIGLSVYRMLPMTDPQLRGDNMFEHGIDWGQYMIGLLAGVALGAPIIAGVWYMLATGQLDLSWWLVPLAAGLGTFWVWLGGRIAENRLKARGPELLNSMRRSSPSRTSTGPGQVEVPLTPAKDDSLSSWQRQIYYNGLWVAPIMVLPQGIIPIIFLLNGSSERVWFLALYAQGGWRWVVSVGMVVAGLSLAFYVLKLHLARIKKQFGK